MSERLDWIEALADNYAHLEGKEVVALIKAQQFTPVEMAFFCQQVVSHIDKVGKASMCLTIFTNRLNDLE